MAGEKKDATMDVSQGISAALVAQMIAEAIKSLATKDQLQLVITDVVTLQKRTSESLAELAGQIDEFVSSRLEGVALALPGEPEPVPLNPDWLKGLIFKGANQKEVEEEGRKKLVSVPFERALEPGDVLSWKTTDGAVILVTADGRKHSVEI